MLKIEGTALDMRILFVQPDSKNEVVNRAMHIYNFEPLGLYYLAGSLGSDNDISLIDLNNELIRNGRQSTGPFMEAIQSFQPDVVAFSALTSVRTGRIKELSMIIKKMHERIVTIVGGPHAALYPSDFQDTNIDIVITRSSIHSFLKAIQLVEQGQAIENINQHVVSAGSSNRRLCLNEWPKAYREIGKKYRGLYNIAIGKPGRSRISQPVASVKTSSGCPFRCNFCCLWQLYPKYETREIDPLVEEIASLNESNVFFADDESLIDVKYMARLARALTRSGVRKNYIMYGRADTISKNPSLIEQWAEAGLREVWIGIEGSTAAQLKEYNKKNTRKSHVNAIRVCRKHCVNVHATALVNKRFRSEDFDYMLKYTKDLLGLESCHFFILTPFKGTAFYRELMRRAPEKFLTTNSDHFSIRQTVLQPEHMTVAEFHQRYANLQKDFNSNTIFFTVEGTDYKDDCLAELEFLRTRNERLHEAIMYAHRAYELKNTDTRVHLGEISTSTTSRT